MGKASKARPARLAEKLTKIRTDCGLSQSELIKKLNFTEMNLTAGSLSNYETGKREPSLLLLLKYARFAGIAVDVLIDDEMELPRTRGRRNVSE